MKSSHRFLAAISILVVVGFLLAGCGAAKPPEAEQKAAQAAMEDAKKVQADKLAAVDWSSASQSMADADKDVRINRMGDARMFYTRAKVRFEKARDVAKQRYDQLLSEAEENQTQINKHYSVVKAQLTKAPAKVRKGLEGTCAEYEKSIAEIEQFRANGDAIRAKLNSAELLKKVYDTEVSLQKK